MVPVHLTLVPTGGEAPTEDQAHTLVDLLWAHATPECGMEHVRARTSPAGIEIVFFIRAAGDAGAQAKAGCLMTAALTSGAAATRGLQVTFHH
ncbi:hypothetical protein [Streptomyces sp. NPDC096339]|uniref:hypothetical protein n=1 Tax=Streptomyces sp. NPDC096339 TaxID=3366086 RepID=UPI00381B66D4